jgi:hypothetical protein
LTGFVNTGACGLSGMTGKMSMAAEEDHVQFLSSKEGWKRYFSKRRRPIFCLVIFTVIYLLNMTQT